MNNKRARDDDVPTGPPRWVHPWPDEVLLGNDILIGQRVRVIRASQMPELVGELGVTLKFCPHLATPSFKVRLDDGRVEAEAVPVVLDARIALRNRDAASDERMLRDDVGGAPLLLLDAAALAATTHGGRSMGALH